MIRILVLTVLVSCLLVGCGIFDSAGNSFTTGAVEGARTSGADTVVANITGKAVRSAIDTVTSEKTRQELAAMLQMILDSIAIHAQGLRDTLLGEYTKNYVGQLRSELIGAKSKQELAAIRDMLLGEKSRILIANLRDELMGDSTAAKARRLVLNLLGPETRRSLDTLLADAMTRIANDYSEKLKPHIDEQESTIKKYATQILWTGAAAVGALIVLAAILFRRLRKHKKIIEVITKQIQSSDESVYKPLTAKIKDKALSAGVEPDLHRILEEEGLNGGHPFQPKH